VAAEKHETPQDYWEARLRRIDIAGLARDHRITNLALLEAAVAEADMLYDTSQYAERYGGPDTLDKIDKPISALLDLLANEINHHYLVVELSTARGVAIAEKFEELPPLLETVRAAAREAHRIRARPRIKNDLRSAYRGLVRFWPSLSAEQFANVWANTGSGLSPTSAAACFIYDVMKQIDPSRTRLAEELRELMANTVKESPGPRRGRRRNLG